MIKFNYNNKKYELKWYERLVAILIIPFYILLVLSLIFLLIVVFGFIALIIGIVLIVIVPIVIIIVLIFGDKKNEKTNLNK